MITDRLTHRENDVLYWAALRINTNANRFVSRRWPPPELVFMPYPTHRGWWWR